MKPPDFGPRPGSSDPERTPVALHARPAPVVLASVQPKGPPPLPAIRGTTPRGGMLAPLGRAEARNASTEVQVFSTDEEPTASRATPAVAARLVRHWSACSPADQRLIEALVLRLRPSVG